MPARKPRAWKPKKPYLTLRARSERIELRPYRFSDFPLWREAYLGRKPKQHRYDEGTLKPSQFTPADFRARVLRHRKAGRRATGFTFPIFERKAGKLLGFIGYSVINAGDRWANLGYAIHNQHWGKGYAAEAARLCLRLGFGPLDFHRIEASCEVGNQASAKTALRCGLKPEGLRRKFFPRNGGIDMLVFAENQIDYRRKNRARR